MFFNIIILLFCFVCLFVFVFCFVFLGCVLFVILVLFVCLFVCFVFYVGVGVWGCCLATYIICYVCVNGIIYYIWFLCFNAKVHNGVNKNLFIPCNSVCSTCGFTLHQGNILALPATIKHHYRV